ncbi:iron chelate uptake ABC transporter family permease subunit [Paracoccus sp. Z330]|uniref:Iron chelate uptake ABC transporter family permease subunit n=1 Tax=Paracoccus onchidii TaxID=3017813 RepID=A0ABT4ZFG1_9RHOB|nr:iron chelate uptake ABC transporter family permease subunit [Paracoccus onchidii]MDB6178056.1 iron chelate uptake ABC transporter family permease subunit [Paracoccus onchidii]
MTGSIAADEPGLRAMPVWQPVLALALLALLAVASLLVGSGGIGLSALLNDPASAKLFLVSRLPRTLALLLAGTASAITGLIMQRLVQNRFVEPSTMGTVDAACLGLLLGVIFLPDAAPLTRMAMAAVASWLGTVLFLLVLRAMPRRNALMPPLLGIAYGGVIGAISAFIAWQTGLMQALGAWTTADFSIVLSGRYELLYVAAGVTALAWFAADRFTLAGLGDDIASSVGLNPRRVLALGVSIVAVTAGSIVVTVGFIPFLGLIVPNLVSRRVGDNLRTALPMVAWLGATVTLACDILGRLVFYPFELPIGATMGVLGAAVFLFLLLKRHPR